MKLFNKKEKGNNSVKELLKKLKRHDTKVVAIAVIIALILSGGLIYISTPIVAENATQDLEEKEKQYNEDTANKLGEIDKSSKDTANKLKEINNYLSELDKVVTDNQQSLSTMNEKAGNDGTKTIIETGKTTNTINEKVTELDTKLKEVHNNIGGTTTKIEDLRTIIEKGDASNMEQIDKDFADINKDLARIKSDYESAQKHINELMDRLQKEMNNGNKELDTKVASNQKALLDELSNMSKNMKDTNTKSLESFQADIKELSDGFSKKLEEMSKSVNSTINDANDKLNSSIESANNKLNANIEKNNESINGNLENVNNSVNSKLDNVNSNVNSKLDNVNTNVNSKLDTVNNNFNSKLDSVNTNVNNNFTTINKSVGDGVGDIKSYIDTAKKDINEQLKSVFQSVSNGKGLLASTLLTYGIDIKKDAKFGQFADAINLLGKAKNAQDKNIEDMSAEISENKIIAGQSITVKKVRRDENGKPVMDENGNPVIDSFAVNGTATSDANATADKILSGNSAYVNGQMIGGSMIDRGSVSTVLTSSQNTIELPAGYYSSIVVSADTTALQLNGTIEYEIGHKHYGTGGGTSPNGCYTQGYNSHEITGQTPGETRYGSHTQDEHDYNDLDGNGECDICWGQHRYTPGEVTYGDVTRYTLGCGHEEKEYIRTTTDISTLADDEQIISAKIIY